jgi:hypothetical protein
VLVKLRPADIYCVYAKVVVQMLHCTCGITMGPVSAFRGQPTHISDQQRRVYH